MFPEEILDRVEHSAINKCTGKKRFLIANTIGADPNDNCVVERTKCRIITVGGEHTMANYTKLKKKCIYCFYQINT